MSSRLTIPTPRKVAKAEMRKANICCTAKFSFAWTRRFLQAKQFKTTWQSEIVRYVIHGVLHLLGHDDRLAAARRRMKREENRLLAGFPESFPSRKSAGASKLCV